MKPPTHLLLAIIPTILLYEVFGPISLIFLIGAVLIDIDHLLWRIVRSKTINPFKIYAHYNKKIDKREFKMFLDDVHVFHTLEFIIICTVLSINNIYFFIFTLGLVYHRIFDIIYEIFVIKKLLNHTLILKAFEFAKR